MGVQIHAEDISISQRLPISSKYKGKRRLSTITVTFEPRSTTEKLIIVVLGKPSGTTSLKTKRRWLLKDYELHGRC